MIKNLVLIISIVLLSVVMILFAYILKDTDTCCKYSICRQFTKICTDSPSVLDIDSKKGIKLTIENIKENDTLDMGSVIKGSITGSWYFEGEFPVRVLNSGMEVIDTLIANAKSDWMTDKQVPFEVVLDFDLEEEESITLRFEKSNPSGLEENADHIDFKIKVKPEEKILTVKAYFPNTNMGSTEDCTLVYPLNREIPYTQAVGRGALNELFKGVTEKEIEYGYFTNLNTGIIIQSLSIQNGIAKVDLNQRLQEGVGGSCKVSSIRAQIEKTLLQFPTVNTVVISIDGQIEDILQP